MALDTTVLATRWGKHFGGINETNTFVGTTIPDRADDIYDLYGSYAAQRVVVDDLYENAQAAQKSLDPWTDSLYTIVEGTLQRMCADDTARPKTDDLFGWFDKLNRDMVAQGDSFAQPTTLTGTVAAGTNVGDGYLVASVIDPIDGKSCYYSNSEVIRFLCSADSYSGNAEAGSETFTVNGETSVEYRDYNWPKGSGASLNMTAINPTTDTLLVDGSIDEWEGTGNDTPTNWTAIGTTGTLVTDGGSVNGYKTGTGTNFAVFTGNGSTQDIGITQEITDVVESSKVYAVQFWIKLPSGTLSTGGSATVFRYALVDGSGNVIADAASTNNSATISASTLNTYTSWTRVSVTFRTPRSLPTQVFLQFKFVTNPLDNGKAVWLDFVDMVEQTRLYNGGPFAALIAGATAFAIDDKFTLTVVNSSGTGSFVRCLDRTFELANNNIRLTVSGSASDADALIS